MLTDTHKSRETRLTEYVQQLQGAPHAHHYLNDVRGLSEAIVNWARLGYVAEPADGDEKYAGRIVIPYLTWSGVKSLRYRCIEDHGDGPGIGCDGHPKIYGERGDTKRLYNAMSFFADTDIIGVTEGEFDALAATDNGVHSVGLPGTSGWQPAYRHLFTGYYATIVYGDGDDPGVVFAEKVAAEINRGGGNARVVLMPPGSDVNSFIVEHGRDEFLKYSEVKA